MKPIIKELMLKPVKEYFLMTVGMIMYSFAWSADKQSGQCNTNQNDNYL